MNKKTLMLFPARVMLKNRKRELLQWARVVGPEVLLAHPQEAQLEAAHREEVRAGSRTLK